MEFLLYLVPVIVFIVLFCAFYYSAPKESRNKDNMLYKNILPSTVVSLLFFYLIKYSESNSLKSEPMMYGGYFD